MWENNTHTIVRQCYLPRVYALWYSRGMEHKKLYRSNTNKVFAGVCGGLGEYFDLDPVVIRLFWLLIAIFSGIFPGVIAYIFAILLIPRKP